MNLQTCSPSRGAGFGRTPAAGGVSVVLEIVLPPNWKRSRPWGPDKVCAPKAGFWQLGNWVSGNVTGGRMRGWRVGGMCVHKREAAESQREGPLCLKVAVPNHAGVLGRTGFQSDCIPPAVSWYSVG